MLAIAADTHWDLPGIIFDAPATEMADGRGRAVRALVRAGFLTELSADPLSLHPMADGGSARASGA